MLKKLIISGAAVTILSGMSMMTPLGSYARCGFNWLTRSANEAVPLEWELSRARQMIDDLQPQISKHAKQIARERIDLARLQRQVDKSAQAVDQARAEIERLSDDLKRGEASYSYAGQTYTSTQVRDDLAARFDRFKTRRQTHARLQQMLAARQASLQSAGQRMEAMLQAKNQLEVEVENVQARIGSLRVAQTSSELNLDDSHLGRTRDLLDNIAARLDVEEEVVATVAPRAGAINLDEPADEDLLDEIASYLDDATPPEDGSGAALAIRLE